MKPGSPATVAIVTDSPSFAGAERYLAVLVSTLAERRFVALLPDPADPEVAAQLVAAGAEIVEVAGLSRRPSIQGARNVRRALRAIGPGLVHVNATDDRDLGPLVACLTSGIPALATVHLVLPHRARWRALLTRAALSRLRCVIAVSEASAADMRLLGVTPRVVRNGLPAPHLTTAARARLGLDAEAFVVGGIGRLHEQKGWDVLCSAAPALVAGCPGAQILVIGDGPQREALRRLPGAEHVRFAGALPDASTLLGAFDVLAMPSRYEGLPLVAIEAMLAGVPVVATAVGGVAEALGDAGALVAVDDAPALAQALLALAHDPDARARSAESGRRRALERFGAQRMADETDAIYAQLERCTMTRPAVAALGRVRNVPRLVARMRAVREPLRFAAAEVRRRPAVGAYTLRRSGQVCYLRHHANDLGAFEDVVLAGEYEPPPAVARWLASRDPGPRILDLGGHVGLFGLDAARRWPNARIVALEPDGGNVALYRRAVQRNNLGQTIEVLARAAYTEPAQLRSAGALGVSSYLSAGAGEHPSAFVDAVDVLPLMHDADLVKMDIEGGEWAILADPRSAGAAGPAIVMEFHERLCPYDDPEAAALAWLESAGLRVCGNIRRWPGMGQLWALDPDLI